MIRLALAAIAITISEVSVSLLRTATPSTEKPNVALVPNHQLNDFLQLDFVKSRLETDTHGNLKRIETRRDPETGVLFNAIFPVKAEVRQ